MGSRVGGVLRMRDLPSALGLVQLQFFLLTWVQASGKRKLGIPEELPGGGFCHSGLPRNGAFQLTGLQKGVLLGPGGGGDSHSAGTTGARVPTERSVGGWEF